jgi:cytochrome c oxidase subunit 4
MNSEKEHITDYKVYALVLIGLLILLSVSVWVTHLQLKAWTVGVALIVACSMATIILTYFMHLKFDHFLLKVLVAAVFLLFVVFVSITLLDYASV